MTALEQVKQRLLALRPGQSGIRITSAELMEIEVKAAADAKRDAERQAQRRVMEEYNRQLILHSAAVAQQQMHRLASHLSLLDKAQRSLPRQPVAAPPPPLTAAQRRQQIIEGAKAAVRKAAESAPDRRYQILDRARTAMRQAAARRRPNANLKG